jgi:uncharacterized protein (TIGR03067 family)
MPRYLFPLLAALLLAAAPPGDETARADLDKLQGTWAMLSMTKNGKVIPADRLKGRVALIKDDAFTDRQDEKVYARGTIALDPGKSPGAIDTRFTEGPIAGKTSLGIYKVDGDSMTSCVAEPGDSRPSSFESKAGTGFMLVVYKRQKS